jgi:hypothetical protein
LSDGNYRKERLAKRAACIHVLLVANKLNASRTELFERGEQVFGRAREAIKAPDQHSV